MPEQVAGPEVFRSLLYSGSVKDVYGRPGRDPYVFAFSDRYSIFDWGEMPDSLPGKGEALAVMGDLLFRRLGSAEAWEGWRIPAAFPSTWRERLERGEALRGLRSHGAPHHSLGLVDAEGRGLPEGAVSRFLAVRALERLPAPSSVAAGKVVFDYSAYSDRPERGLVPLEVVFRFGAPEGSSFLARAASLPSYARSLGFPALPKAGDLFPFPIVELFTKLEPSDRFLPREEAMAVAGLSPVELEDLGDLAVLLALRLRDLFSPLGLELWDGKFEFAFAPGREPGRRGFLLVDSIGPDELRLIGPGGVHFSKELLRRFYRGSPWHEAMEEAKRLAKERGEKDWKRICRDELGQAPGRLPPIALESARLLVPSLANGLARSFLGRDVLGAAPPISELCRRLGEAP